MVDKELLRLQINTFITLIQHIFELVLCPSGTLLSFHINY